MPEIVNCFFCNKEFLRPSLLFGALQEYIKIEAEDMDGVTRKLHICHHCFNRNMGENLYESLMNSGDKYDYRGLKYPIQGTGSSAPGPNTNKRSYMSGAYSFMPLLTPKHVSISDPRFEKEILQDLEDLKWEFSYNEKDKKKK